MFCNIKIYLNTSSLKHGYREQDHKKKSLGIFIQQVIYHLFIILICHPTHINLSFSTHTIRIVFSWVCLLSQGTRRERWSKNLINLILKSSIFIPQKEPWLYFQVVFNIAHSVSINHLMMKDWQSWET